MKTRVSAKYLGGWPILDAGQGIDGKLGIDDRFVSFFHNAKGPQIGFKFSTIVSVELGPLQPAIRQAMLESAQATLARGTLTPVLLIRALSGRRPAPETEAGWVWQIAEARFYVTEGAGWFARLDAAGLANQSQNAAAFRDTVQLHSAEFYREPNVIPVAATGADTIRDLAKLRDEGIISADEFESKKQELLGRI